MKTKAPCGHDGEAVIGAYVRCLQGCSKDPYVQPRPPVVQRRGEPGHVDFCACKPCTVRRRAKKIVIRTKGGKTQEIAWDGVSKTLHWTSSYNDRVRHWKLIDEDGDVLADGMCDVEMYTGDSMRLDIDTLIPAKLTIQKDAWRIEKLPTTFAENYANHVDFINNEIARSYGLPTDMLYGERPEGYPWRQAAKKANFGFPPGYPAARGTVRDLECVARMVEGVWSVEVTSPWVGDIEVVVTEVIGCLDDREERKLAKQVESAVQDAVAAGVKVHATVRTPRQYIQETVLSVVCSQAPYQWPVYGDIKHQVLTQLKGRIDDFSVDVHSYGDGYDITVSYLHEPSHSYHCLRHHCSL